jgi:two-component system, LytTR family, response regulator
MLLARKRIRRYLNKDSEIEIVAECSNGKEAIEAIREHNPQLVFLDVQMPETDGFNVLESVDRKNPPTFIFVTAHDQFALRAFEVNALDYLLKPFSEERLAATLKRAKQQIQQQSELPAEERLLSLISELKGGNQYLNRVTVKERGKIIFVPIEEVDFIEAQGNYLELNKGETTHLIRMRLHQLEAKLNPNKFIRIHRSTIVNIDQIKEMHPLFNGDQTVIMQSGKKLTMTRNYRDKLKSLLGNF